MSDEKKNKLQVMVPINVEGINAAFAELMLKSKLGELIEKELQAAMQEYTMRSVIQGAVKQAVHYAVREMSKKLIETRREEINAKASELVTEEFLMSTIEKFWDRVVNA